MMKEAILIMTMMTMMVTTACSPTVVNKEPQIPVEIVEGTETPNEVVETTSEAKLIPEHVLDVPIETGKELSMLDILAPNFRNKLTLALEDFRKENDVKESYILPTTNHKDSYLSLTTIPSMVGEERVNAFTYIFPVYKIIDGEKQGIKKISVVFVIDEGEFKIVEVHAEES